MIITRRDVSLLRDLALSHVLSRDQVLALGYFGSVTRANTRLRGLIELGFVRRLSTPFFGQGLYSATKRATDLVGENIAPLLASRLGSPRFLQHALAVTNSRIALVAKSGGEWRFEQQLWRKANRHEIRPDGLILASFPTFVEIDMGHVAPAKFKAKLAGYQALAETGICQSLYGFESFRLLTITSGSLRAHHLRRLLPPNAGFDFRVQTFEDIGVARTSSWS